MSTERKKQTENLVLGAILTAIVVVLQILGEFIKFGPFFRSLVLIPIVIGAAKCGVKIGTWFGLVFGTVVLLNGDATAFCRKCIRHGTDGAAQRRGVRLCGV